jgi:hypothetical protein
MKTYTARRGRQHQTKGSDPLRFVKDDRVRGLVIDLDEVYESLMGRALNGDNAAFALAQIVRMASDHLAEQRLGAR